MKIVAANFDAGGLAAERLPSVGAGYKARSQRMALPGVNDNLGGTRLDRNGLIVKSRQIGKFGGAFLQCDHKCAIFSVVAERVETYFVA